ncbi:hypothetical protein GGI15_001545 [Coemansia interrupta]|uniref:Uncharacterized protein n=1 Tax=Coemansia interrupta TaxID=1126814 RepID=A0A9W8HP37_9FUNG|nr:hypothetical protein GGI15_001545 [Coemansia interrupta]
MDNSNTKAPPKVRRHETDSFLARAASTEAPDGTGAEGATNSSADALPGSPSPGLVYGGWAGQAMMGVGGNSFAGAVPVHRSVSRRSSVVSTASASFFDRSFFSTPESRIVDNGKKTTLAYATLMLNIYNNISLDLKAAVDTNRKIVVQTVASKNKVSQMAPDLSRVHADIEDAVCTTTGIGQIAEFRSIKDLLCHSLQVFEEIKRKTSQDSRR